MRLILSLAVFLSLSLPAFAQEGASNKALMQFAANNDTFDKTIDHKAKLLFLRQFPGCANVTQIVRQLPVARGEIVFPSATKDNKFPVPTSGLWTEHVKIRACDKVRQINLLATARADGDPVLLALLPGETRADPAIQRDAERIGATSITKADATCSDAPVATNTRFLSYRTADGGLTDKDLDQGWFEEWSYKFCQKDVSAQIVFMPNADGAFDVKARPIGVAAPQVPTTKPDQTETPAKSD